MSRVKIALDCDVSPRMAGVLTTLYGDRGFEFLHVTEFASKDSEDHHWADAFKRFGGVVTLSADLQIAAKPHLALAFIENEFISFFMGNKWSRAQGHIKAAHLCYWWPAIEQKIREDKRGECWRVPCAMKNGNVILPVECELEALRIPDHVLAEARKAKLAG